MYLSLAAHPDARWRRFGEALTGASLVPDKSALPEVFGEAGARRRLAQAVAPHDVDAALSLLGQTEPVMRAACLAALGQPQAALALVEEQSPPSAEACLVRAGAHAALGRHRQAREAINATFTSHGLAEPLRLHDQPTSLADFETVEPRRSVQGPMVSVVIAMKNAEPTIAIAVGSLLRQTWAQVEVVIVNDASTDSSVARLREAFGDDARVRLLNNQRQPGAYGARNTGIEAARGEFLTFHDADDWAHPERLERQVVALTHGIGATVGGYFRLDGHGQVVNPRIFPLLRVNPILLLARRATLNRMGPLDEVRAGGDTEYLARLEARVGRWAILRLRQPLVVASWLPTSLMGSPETGLGTQGGLDRLAYVEQWRRRHARVA